MAPVRTVGPATKAVKAQTSSSTTSSFERTSCNRLHFVPKHLLTMFDFLLLFWRRPQLFRLGEVLGGRDTLEVLKCLNHPSLHRAFCSNKRRRPQSSTWWCLRFGSTTFGCLEPIVGGTFPFSTGGSRPRALSVFRSKEQERQRVHRHCPGTSTLVGSPNEVWGEQSPCHCS